MSKQFISGGLAVILGGCGVERGSESQVEESGQELRGGGNSYDMGNTQMVLTRCEHYGLHDGPDGKDLQTPYSAATVATLAAKYGSDGNRGGWQLYLMQSLPGYHSGATLPDGTPIKNIWPYLFY